MNYFGEREGGLTSLGRNCQNVCNPSLMYYLLHVGAYVMLQSKKTWYIKSSLFIIVNLVMIVQQLKVMMILLIICPFCIIFGGGAIWLVLNRELVERVTVAAQKFTLCIDVGLKAKYQSILMGLDGMQRVVHEVARRKSMIQQRHQWLKYSASHILYDILYDISGA